VDWLEYAGKAAQASGNLEEWCAYVEDLRDEHYQKYKLRPMLELRAWRDSQLLASSHG